MRRGLFRLGAAAVLVAAGCGAAPAPSFGPGTLISIDSPAASGCGGGPGTPNRISTAFALDHARDIWLHVPRFGIAPELETDAPAVVVVMPGPVMIPTTGHGNGRANNAVCVKIGGVPNIYTDVDMTGAS